MMVRKTTKTEFSKPNIFEDVGELVMIPVDSFFKIVQAATNGEQPDKKDVNTVIGAAASTFLLFSLLKLL